MRLERQRRARVEDRRRAAIRVARAEYRQDRREYLRALRYVNREQYLQDRRFFMSDRARNVSYGCPPGLARKYNGCVPPGLVRTSYRANDYRYFGDERQRYRYTYRPQLFGLNNYGRNDYYYDSGYLVRVNDSGRINSYIPLLGGALSYGNRWPQSYDYYPVSDYYADYYQLGQPDRYRYADNVIYRYDDDNSVIMAIAALLTGDRFTVGQPMPVGYDVYNVPYEYRTTYYDTPEWNYRYSDGYIYQVDPETRLVQAAIDLIV